MKRSRMFELKRPDLLMPPSRKRSPPRGLVVRRPFLTCPVVKRYLSRWRYGPAQRRQGNGMKWNVKVEPDAVTLAQPGRLKPAPQETWPSEPPRLRT